MKGQTRAYLYALTAVSLWSTVAVAFKISLRHVDHIQLLLYSSVVSAFVLFVILLVQKKLFLFKKYTIKDYLRSALLGFLNPFLYYIVLFKAYDILLAQEAQPLNYTWPLVLVLLSIPLLRQKIGPKDIFAVFVSFIGVLVIGTRGDLAALTFSDPLGVGLAVGSSLIWSLFWIYNMRDKRDEVAKLFLNFMFGSVFAFIAVLIFSRTGPALSAGIIAVAYVGIFEMGITFVLWLKALKLSKTTAKVSNLIFLSPFVSLVLIHYILGEKIYYSTLVGLAFIVGGIAIQKYHFRKTNNKN